jgi:hypothetical protein
MGRLNGEAIALGFGLVQMRGYLGRLELASMWLKNEYVAAIATKKRIRVPYRARRKFLSLVVTLESPIDVVAYSAD